MDEGPCRLQQTAWLHQDRQGTLSPGRPWHCGSAPLPGGDQRPDQLGTEVPSPRYKPSPPATRCQPARRLLRSPHAPSCTDQDQPDRCNLVLPPPPVPSTPSPS